MMGPWGPRAERPRRRSFTAEDKLTVLAEYDDATPGAKGAILRREGLYSHTWWSGAASVTPGRCPAWAGVRRASPDRPVADPRRVELARSRAALEVMGKAHDTEPRSKP